MADWQVFDALHDRPHPAGQDPLWQESCLFVWHDAQAGLGGFWRLGQEPAAGALNSCFGVFTDDGQRFRSNVVGVPMAPSDRGEAHMGWGPQLRATFGDRLLITADFPDCEARLQFDDFHARFDYFRMCGPEILHGAPHFEVAGHVHGTVRIGQREITIDALGYRDRSWGRRDWGGLRGTRWWPCVFGPDLSLHMMHALTADGYLLKIGYVLRNGQLIRVVDSDVIVHLESDALSPRGGTARLDLETGESLTVSCDSRDGIVLHVRGYTAVEAIGRVQLDGRIGFSNLEVSTNASGGTAPPALALGANNSEGLSHR